MTRPAMRAAGRGPASPTSRRCKGKKVAANTSAQITMNGLLANEGMTEKDVQFVNLPGGEMAGALAKGDVDAACVWQPLLEQRREGTPGGKLLGLDSDTPNFKKFGTMASPDIMIISRKLVDEQPELAAQAGGRDLQGRRVHQRQSAGHGGDGGALLPQAARGGARGDEDSSSISAQTTGRST